MLTGTPLDLTPFGDLLRAAGLLYWGAMLVLAGLALWRFKRWWVRVGAAALALAVFIVPVAQRTSKQQVVYDAAKAKAQAAQAHFQMRCQGAGEKIHRVVDNVDGVVWMKWRDKQLNDGDQFKLDDPFGRDCGGDDCITQLLRITTGMELDPQKKQHRHVGYRFVESVDPADGKAYRYTLNLFRPHDRDQKWLETHVRTELLRQPLTRSGARYGITWDDISTREDREHWIAGGSIKVIDLQTNEVVGERVGYMMDPGLGSTAGFRSPWLFAQQNACPEFQPIGQTDSRRRRGAENRRFIFQVLRPSAGE
jgi:hypothetical protein